MTRLSGKDRRPSTIIRDNQVHKAYEDLCKELGEYVQLFPRNFIYDNISVPLKWDELNN